MRKDSKIFVAGDDSLIGGSIIRELIRVGFLDVVASSNFVDLKDQKSVDKFFQTTRPEYVFLVGGPSGGIQANLASPADFMLENLRISVNIVSAAHVNKCEKLMFVGSSCVYPRESQQPMKTDYLYCGRQELTSEPYSLAKLSIIRLCKAYRDQYGVNFISAIPADAFGPGDNFDPDNSHVVAALIRRFHEAKVRGDKSVSVWGTGSPRREFIFVDDVANACVFLMKNYASDEVVNIGTGQSKTIFELADAVKKVVEYSGEIELDLSKPDGAPVKYLDSQAIKAMGWSSKTTFERGLLNTYNWFLKERTEIGDFS